MKKKICSWLDSNITGGIQILDDKIFPCCGTQEPFYAEKNLDYSKISIEELMAKRKELYERINCGTACKGCERIIEKEENNIDIGKIGYLSIGLFSTCNLRCKYCYFTHEELGKKLTPDRTHLLPFVKKLYEHGVLKNNVSIGIAGGEPTLLEDLPETINYLSEKCTQSSLVLLSNSSISNRIEKFATDIKKCKIQKTLYTSIDAGTADTYKLIRGRDLFYAVKNNLIYYAKNNTFNNIILKYILMLDHSNTSDKDIFGFLTFFGCIMMHQKNKITMTIDCDMTSSAPFDERVIAAAGKLYYAATKIFGVDVNFCGGGITNDSLSGRKRILKIQEFADKYKQLPKSLNENFTILKLHLFAAYIHIIKTLRLIPRIFNLAKILYFE